jgi:4-amino-4-deoxy-L-arabinose transferase-like glycosyltransferase
LEKVKGALLSLAGLNCAFQIAWFWRYSYRNINFDAISYIGIARHLQDGDFKGALHGYWSPLISWLIALGSFVHHDPLLVGRIVTILSFLICMPLLYVFTFQLWGKRTVAAISVLCFTLSRGVAAFSVSFIGADFLLTAAVLLYFNLLLNCLRDSSSSWRWFVLGGAHAIAFLAKAFAMPWLLISTIIAAAFSRQRKLRQVPARMALAFALPLLVYVSWAAALNTKYQHFTAGYQAKLNLLDTQTRKSLGRGNLHFLANTSKNIDGYMITDIMYPGSQLWDARVDLRRSGTDLVEKEIRTVPEALKQLAILITPGGIIAFAFALLHLGKSSRSDMQLALIVLVNVITLVGGYCMLVFDSRYVLPLVPLLLALAAPFLIPNPALSNKVIRAIPGVLFLGFTVFFLLYWASPFRNMSRDYQTGVYSTATALRQLPQCDRLVVIGKGPFPEHGVGWEAGIYASYFAECRVVGFSEEYASDSDVPAIYEDLQNLKANSILVVGSASFSLNPSLEQRITGGLGFVSKQVYDPQSGLRALMFWKP